MQELNLPACDLIVRRRAGRPEVYDALRDRYVRLTPEEWVRQHFIKFLIHERGVPAGLITVEHAFWHSGQSRRIDILIHDRAAKPLVLVECKAPQKSITQATFDQAGRYNYVMHAPYLIVTNGLAHYACEINFDDGGISFLEALPDYDTLVAS